MNTNFIVRQTTDTDYPEVYNLIRTAFETAEHRDGTEQDFAADLRKGTTYIPGLDLVAEQDGRLIGHIMLTKIDVTRPDGSRYDTLLVAPLSVLLEHRSCGIGKALMTEGLRRAAEMGYGAAFLLGDPAYYRRFGYEASYLHGIRHDSFPPENLMVKELLPHALDGIKGLVNI